MGTEVPPGGTVEPAPEDPDTDAGEGPHSPTTPDLDETDGSSSGAPDPAPGAAPEPIAQPVPVGPAPYRPAPIPSALGPFDFLGSIVTSAVGNVALVLRPEAALAVATEFTFPLVLALAVLLYVVAQDQVDRRDPKLRMAPPHQRDTLIRFEAEERL